MAGDAQGSRGVIVKSFHFQFEPKKTCHSGIHAGMTGLQVFVHNDASLRDSSFLKPSGHPKLARRGPRLGPTGLPIAARRDAYGAQLSWNLSVFHFTKGSISAI